MIESPGIILLVLAVLVAVPVLLRRHKAGAPDAVRVVGRTALNKNAVVAVVAVGDRRMLVGAGERGVQLLADLDPPADAGDLDNTTTTTSFGRTDVAGLTTSPEPTDDAHDVLAGVRLGGEFAPAGPRTGLVDRLRAMTVRTPVPGRPSDVPLFRR